MRRPVVVALVLFSPWPAYSGITRRWSAIVDAVGEASDLTIALVAPRYDSRAAPGDVDVRWLPRSASRAASIAEILKGLGRGRTIATGMYRRPSVRRGLEKLLDELHPDILLVHGIPGAAIAQGLFPADATIVDLPDFEPDAFARIASALPPASRVQYLLDVPLTRRWLRRSLSRYRAVSAVSIDDVACLAGLAPDARCLLVPNGSDPEGHVNRRPGRGLLFVGSLDHHPNRQGVAWFVDKVLALLPLVQELRLVGGGEFPEAPRVVQVGTVDDLRSEWERAAALIVPIFSGGGTRVKVLDAFAAGTPVVATRAGMSGIDATPDVHFLQADTAEEFAAALQRVLNDPGLGDQLAAAASALVFERYSWQMTLRPLLDELRR